jgi:hypothetical protein
VALPAGARLGLVGSGKHAKRRAEQPSADYSFNSLPIISSVEKFKVTMYSGVLNLLWMVCSKNLWRSHSSQSKLICTILRVTGALIVRAHNMLLKRAGPVSLA